MQLLQGDSREVLHSLETNSIDSVVTDPPYGLKFMGNKWDGSGIEYDPELWGELLRVLKPGGHVLSFGGTRTYHHMAVAVEDAGFEIRDCIMWLYGQGFPKSRDISKEMDKRAGFWRGKSTGVLSDNTSMSGPNYERAPKGEPITDEAKEWNGWGTSLKPAVEPIVMARKPISEKTIIDNVLKWGTGAINIADNMIELNGEIIPINVLKGWSGFGQEKRPAYEATTNTEGRWPANVIMDAEAGEMLGEKARFYYCAKASPSEKNFGLESMPIVAAGGLQGRHDGSLGKTTMAQNVHPTVKPVDLMRYLCNLVTPTGGVVLDPFLGSGSTGIGALIEGFDFIGIELSPEYLEIATKRIMAWKERSIL
jgi:DNA modification methylase